MEEKDGDSLKSPVEAGPLQSALVNAEKEQDSKTSTVHPQSSYEYSNSTVNTPFGSDDEAEMSDIKRAQHLGVQMSAIDNSIPNRSVRTIVRGDLGHTSEELEDSRRRRRKYLVATDLSEESVYALEWTIGTILRDGDTMFAVYAFSEERETGKDAGAESSRTSQDGNSQAEEESVTSNDPSVDQGAHLPRTLFGRFGGVSHPENKTATASDIHGSAKTELERVQAVETITKTCVRLLRKTLLQVRVAVEVIRCKSPRHMITEAVRAFYSTI